MVQTYESSFDLPSNGTTRLDEELPTRLPPTEEARVLKTLQTNGSCEGTPRYVSKKYAK